MTETLALFAESSTYVSLLTLTLMEIVLGIDNVIFISILASRLPQEQQAQARSIGLLIALVTRLMLLFCIAWIVGLVDPLFSILGHTVSGRDLILLGGGIFLLAKSTLEIHAKLEGGHHQQGAGGAARFWPVIAQIVLLDIVFSFDSVITAVGLVKHIAIMIIAVIISLIVMLVFAGAISAFVERHPTIKMLALSFLLMIGTLLVAEGFHFHVPKGYIYFAMAFSLFVEMLNLKMRSRAEPVQLRPGLGL